MTFIKQHTKARIQQRVVTRLWFAVTICIATGVYAGSDTKGVKINNVELQKTALQQKQAASTIESVDINEIDRILALSDDIEFGEYLAGECTACHLPVAASDSVVPVIHGVDPTYLVQALLEYRAGIRSNVSMAQVAKGLDDEEVAALVKFLTTYEK